MRPCMYIFLNSQVGMSTGKAAAQAGHAAVEAYRLSNDGLVRQWYAGGHYMKVVLDGGDATSLITIDRYLRDRGFRTALIVDEGHTEIAPFTVTAIGVEVVDKDSLHASKTFGEFELLREEVEPNPNKEASLWHRLRSTFSRNDTKGQSPA